MPIHLQASQAMSSCERNRPITSQSGPVKLVHPEQKLGVQDAEDNSNSENEIGALGGEEYPVKYPSGIASKVTRNKCSRQRYFGIGKGVPTQQPQVINSDDYEQRYPDDKLGEELSPNARFYRVYIDEHEKYRFELVEGWKDNLDVLLVFAGLFSAVVTTIVVEASRNLLPDYAELTTTLLIHQSAILSHMLALQQGTPLNVTSPPPAVEITFIASTSAKWVNGLWFTSLALALATALVAVVSKQWLQIYMSSPTGTPQKRARLLHMRYMSLEKWKVPTIIGLLPFLLHISLLLFFCGLVIYLFPVNHAIGIAVGLITLACYLAYFATTILPLINPTCAYQTPLPFLVYSLLQLVFWLIQKPFRRFSNYEMSTQFHRVHKWAFNIHEWLKNKIESLQSLRTFGARELSLLESTYYAQDIDLALFKWMYSFSFSPSATSITLQAACSPEFLRLKVLTDHQTKFELAHDLERSLYDNINSALKGERFARALLSAISGESVIEPWTIVPWLARKGMLLLPPTWADLLPHFDISFSANLAILAYDPYRFGHSYYWEDRTSPSIGYSTIRSLVLSNLDQRSDDAYWQKIFSIISAKIRSWDKLQAIKPTLTTAFANRNSQLPITPTESHIQILAFLGLVYGMTNCGSNVYTREDILDGLEECVCAFGKVIQDGMRKIRV